MRLPYTLIEHRKQKAFANIHTLILAQGSCQIIFINLEL